MPRYLVTEESGADIIVTADNLDDAVEEARDWVCGGDYPEQTETLHVGCSIVEVCDCEDCTVQHERHWATFQIDPEEPACATDDPHDWSESDAYAASCGGIGSLCHCKRCGLQWRYVSLPGNQNTTEYRSADVD